MTGFDDLLDELAGRIDSLPRRAVAAFFLASGTALLVEYRRWAAHRGIEPPPVLPSTVDAVTVYVIGDVPPASGPELLAALEVATPPGAAPDGLSSTGAQDCLICLDVSLRVAMFGDVDAGPCVEYALQPVTESVSHRLLGVSQPGSGPGEVAATARLLADRRVQDAAGFCRWAAGFLRSRPELSAGDLAELTRRAGAALVP